MAEIEITVRVKLATDTEPSYLIATTGGYEVRAPQSSLPDGREGTKFLAEQLMELRSRCLGKEWVKVAFDRYYRGGWKFFAVVK